MGERFTKRQVLEAISNNGGVMSAVQHEWLGDAIVHDIEQTKLSNIRAYENIYLGIITGTGQNVFENVELREITNEEIASFDYLYIVALTGAITQTHLHLAFPHLIQVSKYSILRYALETVWRHGGE